MQLIDMAVIIVLVGIVAAIIIRALVKHNKTRNDPDKGGCCGDCAGCRYYSQQTKDCNEKINKPE